MTGEGDHGYLPISDYAIIGNLRSVALVGRNGSIDWCCLPEMDSPSVFAALLDRRRGGCFRVRPAGCVEAGEQRYIDGTNVLRTVLDGSGGRLRLTDYMPLNGPLHAPTDVEAPAEVHRILSCEEDEEGEEGEELTVEIEWSPRFDYARATTRMWIDGARIRASGASAELSLEGLPGGSFEISEDEAGPVLRARFVLRAGEPRALVMRHGEHAAGEPDADRAQEMCEETIRAWKGWVHVCDPAEPCAFSGPLHEEAVRSALTLKLLTYGPTGAIAAAPTTSLPEAIGGVRNWDYRYSWVRDSALIAQSLFGIGHRAEAVRFLEWQEEVAARENEEGYDLQIMYRLDGERDLEEEEIPELEGYRGSRPVRIGNGASGQPQLDVYGELISAAFELKRIGGRIEPGLWGFLASAADRACALWREPDHGFWEVRCDPRHFVSSKVLLWTGLDRAVRMAEECDWPGDVDSWRGSRDAIHEMVLERGYDPEVGSFVRSFGSTDLDASNLLIPLLGFLPAEDPRVQGTIDRTMERLCTDGLVHRYLGEDGLPGGEGAFVLCTFWLVDALALSGRREESHAVFDRIFECRNHVGLLPEEIDPETGEFLGNFPQAFSQSALINSAMYMAEADGNAFGEVPLLGSRSDRREGSGQSSGD